MEIVKQYYINENNILKHTDRDLG
jgi:hypothetical protein